VTGPSHFESLTVLRAIGSARATKQWRWDKSAQQWTKISYQAGAWFTPSVYPVSTLAGLVDVLEQVQHDPQAFVVRGDLAPNVVAAVAAADEARRADPRAPLHRIRRRKHMKNGVDPSLVEVARRWVMIDVDDWPLPGWGDLVDDPETAIDTAIHELLPEAFHDAACWWQLSSSAGFAAGYLKVHLFFWLSEPATNLHLKAVLKQHAPGVDTAPFNAAQPHYIAAPIIEGGHDPLPRRTGWRQGIESEVVLPVLRHIDAKARPTGTGAAGRVGSVMDALAYLGDGEGLEGFHAPLRTAVMRYAGQVARYGNRDDDTLKASLKEAVRAAPRRLDRDVENPYCTDYYLDASIGGAFSLLAGDEEIQTMRPHHEAPGRSVPEARGEMKEHISGFMARALAWHRLGEIEQAEKPPEHSALVVDVGLGKTTTTREALAGFILAAMGKDRSFEEIVMQGALPSRVLWLVPTHKLGNETLTKMRELGLNVAVMRGREADEPGTEDPDDGKFQRMCLNLPAVEDALEAGYDVEGAACGSPKEGMPRCPYRDQCAYQRQKKVVAQADVVITSHQSLFHHLPKEISNGLGLVVADESWWQIGLRANQQSPLLSFPDVPLSHPVLRKEKTGKKSFRYVDDQSATNDLHALSAKVVAAFSTIDDQGFVSREAVVAAEITIEDCNEAIKLEWRRKREGLIYPGQAPAERKKALVQASGNRTIPRRAAIWDALREVLEGSETHTGRLQVDTLAEKAGPTRAIIMHGRAQVRDDIAALPILLLDATMPVSIVRHYLPRLEVLAEVKAVAPHMQVHQVIGGWGKTSIVPSDRAAPEENRRREGLVRELADFVRAHTPVETGDAETLVGSLVVTYDAIEDQFSALPDVRTGHFNAIAGLDTFGKVRSLFVIGRPMPDPREMRADTLALTGRAIPAELPHQETRGALMADGSGASINVRAYADADLEAVRVAITDAEVIQAIGRGRAINRTAETPLDVFVMADVVVPLPVNRLVRWIDVRLDPIARMAARGAIFSSPTDAAKAYPDLFPTNEAAKKALQRAGAEKGYFGDIPLGLDILRGMSPKSVSYRPGAGASRPERRSFQCRCCHCSANGSKACSARSRSTRSRWSLRRPNPTTRRLSRRSASRNRSWRRSNRGPKLSWTIPDHGKDSHQILTHRPVHESEVLCTPKSPLCGY